MTVVINLLAGSGVGKSTTAADLFAKLKLRSYNAELIQEFVKKWAWLGRKPTGFDQVYLFGKQAQSESCLYGKVDYLVTDSPLILSAFYESYHLKREIVLPAVFNFLDYAKENGVIHKNYFLSRNKPFDPRGRYETAEEASRVDHLLKDFLAKHGVEYKFLEVEDSLRAEAIIADLEGDFNENTRKD